MYTHDPDKILSEIRQQARGEIVRVSLANLISDIRGEVAGIINKKGLLYGRRKLGSIGGAAELYDRSYLQSLGAYDFEKADCKFKIPLGNLDKILEITRGRFPDYIEAGPDREIREELCQEILPGYQDRPVLEMPDLDRLTNAYAGTMYDSGFGISNARKDISLYIWRYFTIGGSKEIIRKICRSDIIHKVTLRECRLGRTDKGILIGPNVKAASDLIYE